MIELDIFSDTVCPWCYIGKKRLEKAINDHKNQEFKQTWRPFQLNPGMPPDGMDRQEYLISKFGSADAAKTIYENGQTLVKFSFGPYQTESEATLIMQNVLRSYPFLNLNIYQQK